jgi:hypothetical protein
MWWDNIKMDIYGYTLKYQHTYNFVMLRIVGCRAVGYEDICLLPYNAV